uniref:Uncharacterized protein n=1 Tax=Glossina pallidipes TaxID=7398 RepID=A0A1B0A736_GLOPL
MAAHQNNKNNNNNNNNFNTIDATMLLAITNELAIMLNNCCDKHFCALWRVTYTVSLRQVTLHSESLHLFKVSEILKCFTFSQNILEKRDCFLQWCNDNDFRSVSQGPWSTVVVHVSCGANRFSNCAIDKKSLHIYKYK